MTPAMPVAPRRGFALIESLLALLVVSLGLLALGATYLKLSRSEDVAKQRGEAMRLAEQKIEEMRAYTQIATAAGVVSWNGLAGGNDQVTTNAQFTRTWSLSGATSDTMRTLAVTVTWTDRGNEAQSVTQSTVISRTDPADTGLLGFPLPANTTLKRPKNRNLNIPVPASDLGNGESAFRMPNTNYAIVFSNDSGYIVKTCGLAAGVTTITLADLSGCTTAYAYILAGYISLYSVGSFPSSLAINTGSLSGTNSVTCSLSDATDQGSGAVISGYKYYICVVSVGASGAAWSGMVKLAAPGLNAGSNYLVCRFQYAASGSLSANQRNVQPYSNVAESLDSQNYVITDNATCPTISGLATVLHQSCRSSNAARATDCPAS